MRGPRYSPCCFPEISRGVANFLRAEGGNMRRAGLSLAVLRGPCSLNECYITSSLSKVKPFLPLCFLPIHQAGSWLSICFDIKGYNRWRLARWYSKRVKRFCQCFCRERNRSKSCRLFSLPVVIHSQTWCLKSLSDIDKQNLFPMVKKRSCKFELNMLLRICGRNSETNRCLA